MKVENNRKLLEYSKELGKLAELCFSTDKTQSDAFGNKELYKVFIHENYDKSFANPDYCSKLFGDIGPLLSSMFYKTLMLKDFVFNNNEYAKDIYSWIKTFVTNINDGKTAYMDIKKYICDFSFKLQKASLSQRIKTTYCSSNQVLMDIILNSDLSKPDYLYNLNIYVTEDEIKLSEHIATLPQEQIDAVAVLFIEGYLRAYVRNNMDRAGRGSMGIEAIAGMERFTKALILEIKKRGFTPFVIAVESSPYNIQLEMDHKEDNAVYLSDEHQSEYLKDLAELFAKNKKDCLNYSGVFVFTAFGKNNQSLNPCENKIKYSSEQADILRVMTRTFFKERENVIPEENRSFSIIGFPRPSIHKKFEEVFDWFIKINSLKNEEFEQIQATIIDALDTGDYVHIKGAQNNETDIKIMLAQLTDCTKQTRFFNCGADDNIPVGEVFTSPVLKGTNGTLHVDEIILSGINYKDLKIEFRDGYIKEYSCANYDSSAKAKEFIKESLLSPYDTLPMGEFAVGTNTLAYAVAKKYDIIDKLNILITEKMGPHFAIGDTCYSEIEDIRVFNPDGKEIIAKDNEHSIKRLTNEDAAYTDIHTDITLPYEQINHLKSIKNNGDEITIIKDGLFVLKGTEKLNEYLNMI